LRDHVNVFYDQPAEADTQRSLCQSQSILCAIYILQLTDRFEVTS
jgi:hypothetical protein